VNGFIGQLKIRAFSPEEVAAADGGSAALYQLLEDFGYHSDAFGTFMAPAGMITDFASIPKPALWFINDDSPGILFASVIHDFLYINRGARAGLADLSRQDADAVLFEAMGVCGASRLQRSIVYRAVRIGGGKHWN
jgi:hypothetical protein